MMIGRLTRTVLGGVASLAVAVAGVLPVAAPAVAAAADRVQVTSTETTVIEGRVDAVPFWRSMRPGTRPLEVFVDGPVEVSMVTGTWRILTPAGQPLTPAVEGQITPATRASEYDSVFVGAWTLPSMASGTYRIEFDLTASTEAFGEVPIRDAGQPWRSELRVDGVAPRLSVRALDSTFYPEPDEYKDQLAVDVTTDEPVGGRLEVIDAAGRVVMRRHGEGTSPRPGGDRFFWDGRTNAGKLVPAGRYTLKFVLSDEAGNTGAASTSVVVSRKKLTWVTTTHKISARKSAVGKPIVGKCSTVRRKGASKGSVRLLSNARCTKGANASVAGNEHALVLPKAHGGQYEWMKVSVKGRALGKGHAAALMHVNPKTGELHSVKALRGKGVRTGPKVWLTHDNVDGRKGKKPSVHWIVATTEGNRYRVDSFSVKVRYRVLK